jgi:hypothetical protein
VLDLEEGLDDPGRWRAEDLRLFGRPHLTTPTWRRGHAFLRLLPVAMVAGAALVPVGASAGDSESTCTFENGVLSIDERFVSGEARMNIWQDTSGYAWVALDAYPIPGFCSNEPIQADAVESVVVNGGPASLTLTIHMTRSSADPAAPGPPVSAPSPAADWGTATWDIDLGSDRHEGDELYIYSIGGTQDVRVVGGDEGIDLDGDGSRDLVYSSTLSRGGVVIDPGTDGQQNYVSMAGGAATGGPMRLSTSLGLGEYPGQHSSRNVLIGGSARDRLTGSSGTDRLVGGPGKDYIVGNSGDDRILGGPAHDIIIGGPGRDTCAGGPGRDRIVSCEVVPS